MEAAPIDLRAHSALCLQGFRGEGYSPAFVARMAAVHARLRDDPRQTVRLLASPDVLCDACPHHQGGCTLQGADHEAHMRAQDEEVLRRLGFTAGEVVAWEAVLGRIAARVRGADLGPLCTSCPWLPRGWCQAGIDRLRRGAP